METHKYILRDSDVGGLATSVALQDGDVNFRKDDESSFYIATVLGSEIAVPDDIAALEMFDKPVDETSTALVKTKNPKIKADEDESTDLTVRLHFSQAIKADKLPIIYEEIAKAIDSAIRKIDEPEK